MKIWLKKLRQLLPAAVGFLTAGSLGGMIYGRVVAGTFTPLYIFRANFLAGAMVISAGIVMLIVPVPARLQNNKLLDHSNYTATVVEQREEKRKTAHIVMFLGMGVIMLTAVIEFFLVLIL